MDADHVHAWEQGNVARALVVGQGFGSPFVSKQPSSIMTPVYPLVVAGIFKVFGVHTARSIFAVHAFDCLINSLACIPIFLLARRGFSEQVGLWAAWTWVFFPYGIYFAAAWAWSTHLLLLCLLWLLYLAQSMEQSSRLRLWAGFGLLAGFAGLTEPSILIVIPFLMALAAWRLARAMADAGGSCVGGSGGYDFAVADSRRGGVSPVHSDAGQHGAGALDGKQWLLRTLDDRRQASAA